MIYAIFQSQKHLKNQTKMRGKSSVKNAKKSLWCVGPCLREQCWQTLFTVFACVTPPRRLFQPFCAMTARHVSLTSSTKKIMSFTLSPCIFLGSWQSSPSSCYHWASADLARTNRLAWLREPKEGIRCYIIYVVETWTQEPHALLCCDPEHEVPDLSLVKLHTARRNTALT